MKALTVCQPFAWLMANGHKKVENRNWVPPASMLGAEFLLHCGVGGTPRLYRELLANAMQSAPLDLPPPAELTRQMRHQMAHVVARVRIVGVLESGVATWTEPGAEVAVTAALSDPWYAGGIGWVLVVTGRVKSSPMTKGQLKLWNICKSQMDQLVWE